MQVAPASSLTTYVVAYCATTDIDATSGQCANIQWLQPPAASFVPPLTAAQGALISGAIASVWVLGFLVREIRKTMGVHK